ncbi:hypothetical protein ACN47E_004544 [Coniothyrium glycines]
MTILTPFAFSPSQRWDGNSGNWSSFLVRIGQPEQDFRVLPSSATGAVFVPDFTGCQPSSRNPPDCAALRGVVNSSQSSGFQPNASETWMSVGTYEAHIATELGYNASATYGRDSVGLVGPNSGAPTLTDQVVGSLIQQQPFFVGFFGLSPKAFNFSDLSDPRPSSMTSLKNAGLIPSLSYGYTAGAFYKHTLGSLTLGGYDEKRFIPHISNHSFPFGPDDERPTSLTLQRITASNTPAGTVSLLKRQIYVNIDFTMPYLWLPADTCELIASQFNLTHNIAKNVYLVDSSAHTQLLKENPSFTFEFGENPAPGKSPSMSETVSIVISYAAFDLDFEWPNFPNTTRYFPIRQANESQYTLGRAFMQEAYLTVDYERHNFSLQQALFPAASEQKLVAITPIAEARNAGGRASKIHLSKASIAGIAIAGAVCVAIIVVASVLYCRSRHTSHDPTTRSDAYHSAAREPKERTELAGQTASKQLMGTAVSELKPESRRAELSQNTGVVELPT